MIIMYQLYKNHNTVEKKLFKDMAATTVSSYFIIEI